MEIGSGFKDDGCESHEWVRLVNDRGSSGNGERGKKWSQKQSSMSEQQKKVQLKAVIRILIRFFASPSAAVSRMKPLEVVSFSLPWNSSLCFTFLFRIGRHFLRPKAMLLLMNDCSTARTNWKSVAWTSTWISQSQFLVKKAVSRFCSGCWCSPSLVIHIEYWVGHEARYAPAKSCLLYTTRYKNSSRVSWALQFIPFSAAKLGTEAHN